MNLKKKFGDSQSVQLVYIDPLSSFVENISAFVIKVQTDNSTLFYLSFP